jgi:Winged helix-turn helix
MEFSAVAVERAMTYQQVIMRALAGTWTWLKAADVLGIQPRSLRRWRARYERDPVLGLLDRRRRRPSHRIAPRAEVQRILHLYRERYQGFNVRHFLHVARRDHGVTLSYTFVKLALQAAGLVPKGRARGRHRRRREPRACLGELLHLDGSDHEWLARCPGQRQTLITTLDDATKRLLYAELWPEETTHAVLTALRAVLAGFGLPMALYTDRAGWAFHTPTAGGRVDRTHLTVVGQILARLGIEHIPSYSPQARGRVERLNRTLQGRLINELRVAGITTLEAANAYLREQFLPDYHTQFTRPPADPASAFVPLGDTVDLDQLLADEAERVVGRDNVVSFEGVALQLAKQPGRRSCAGLRVTVRHHLSREHTVWRGPQCLGRYDATGRPLDGPRPRAPKLPRSLHRSHPASRSKNARAHLAQDAKFRGRRSSDIPPHPSRSRRRRGPRLPVGPGE